MKRIKLSEPELLAVIVNLQKELGAAFEMLAKKSKNADRLKDRILSDLNDLLNDEYNIDTQDRNLYDALFKNAEKVKTS